MTERINWIDWAKTIAIAFVVFGHLPEPVGSIPLGYVTTFHMPLFFLISGYLKKRKGTVRENLKKYTRSLVVPYLLYNAVFYPYWVVKFVMENPASRTDLLEYLRPVLGTLFLQVSSAWSTPCNGVTWFLAALLLMHLTFDAASQRKSFATILTVAILLCIGTNALNSELHFLKDLLPIGSVRCFPFYCLGYWLKSNRALSAVSTKKDVTLWLLTTAASIGLYQALGHRTPLVCFYLVSCVGSLSILYLCKSLNSIRSEYVVNTSLGTLVIMGLHWMCIGAINFALEKAMGLPDKIVYPWYLASLMTLFIVALLYPVIVYTKKRLPVFLGK